MRNLKKILSRVRIRIRRSSPLEKCALLVVIVGSIIGLLTIRSWLINIHADTESLRQEAIALEQENQELSQRIAELGTVKSLHQIAGEELGLVDPNSEFFTTQENTNP